MKLALVVRRLGTMGGTERFVHGLAGWLVRHGHAVDVWCAGVDTPVDGVTVQPLRVWGRGRILKMLSLARSVRRIPRANYDSVLGFIRAPGFDLFRAGGGCHRAWVARSGWSLADAVEVFVDRRAVQTARRVVANSQMAADELMQHYRVPADRIALVRNGVDLTRFRADAQARLPIPQPAIAFLGSGYARKGLITAIRAMQRLDGVHLAVMGHDRFPGRFRRYARRLGVGDRVHVMGPVIRPEGLLPAARALVLPTRYDPFANVCLEAMACGVPVVTTRSNGAAEVLPEPWMVIDDPEDADAFALALERVLQDSGLRARCREVAAAYPADAAFSRIAALVTDGGQ